MKEKETPFCFLSIEEWKKGEKRDQCIHTLCLRKVMLGGYGHRVSRIVKKRHDCSRIFPNKVSLLENGVDMSLAN